MSFPKMIQAEVPGQGNMYYLVDDQLEFVPEVKEFLEWKAATKRAPATIKAYCYRLEWFYRFLHQRHILAMNATPADLTEFVRWLCNQYRDTHTTRGIHEHKMLQTTSVNLILQAVGALYRFLVRRGQLVQSPVLYIDVPRGKWLAERDMLAHTRKGLQTVQRMELKLKEPKRLPKTISEQDFHVFIDTIHLSDAPNGDPAGFRDRLICLLLKEGGFRLGELLGARMEDLDFGGQGMHVRFRPNNENGARAKAGYGRDRFVHLPTSVLGLLDIYITEVWIEANPQTDHLWIVLKKDAKTLDGASTFGRALTGSAVEKMFQHYSKKSGVMLHPHTLRHTHATALVRSYLSDSDPLQGETEELTIDWKFIQERLGHASVVTTMQTYIHLSDTDRRRAYDKYIQRREQKHGR